MRRLIDRLRLWGKRDIIIIFFVFTINFYVGKSYYAYDEGGSNSTLLLYFMGMQKVDINLIRCLFYWFPILTVVFTELEQKLLQGAAYRVLRYGAIHTQFINSLATAFFRVTCYFLMGISYTKLLIDNISGDKEELFQFYFPNISADYPWLLNGINWIISSMVLLCVGMIVEICTGDFKVAWGFMYVLPILASVLAYSFSTWGRYLPVVQMNLWIQEDAGMATVYNIFQFLILAVGAVFLYYKRFQEINL